MSTWDVNLFNNHVVNDCLSDSVVLATSICGSFRKRLCKFMEMSVLIHSLSCFIYVLVCRHVQVHHLFSKGIS